MSRRLTFAEVERLNAKVFAARFKKDTPDALPPPHDGLDPARAIGVQSQDSGGSGVRRRLSSPSDEISETGSGGLHDKIEAELKRRRWFYVKSRTDRRSTQQKGVPDFIVAARATNSMHDNGKTFWIEAKARGNKLSKEQNITRHVLLALGHKFSVVFSMKEFLAVIDDI